MLLPMDWDIECCKKRRPNQLTLNVEWWTLKDVELKTDYGECVGGKRIV